MIDDTELMPAVILAGGYATRMRPLTERIPKALIDIAGKPFLWHQLQLLKRHGIRRAVLAVGYLGESIRDCFGDGTSLGMALEYSFDGPALLGTAGAVKKALPLLPDRFFVLYGDSYLTCDYRSVQTAFLRCRRSGLMTVYRNDGLFDRSNVEYDGMSILKYDKSNRSPAMRHIDYGLGAFQRGVFESIPIGQAKDLVEVYQGLLEAGELSAFEVFERFYEIGSPQGLRDTVDFLGRAATPGVEFSPDVNVE